MAHDLLIEDGKAAMFYVGTPPWHRLGTRLDNPATAEDAIKAANLNWTVSKVPLYVAGGTRLHELPGRFATVRQDRIGTRDLRAFGIVGEKYEPLQNRHAFRFFDDIVGDGKAIYHTAGALGDGERIWILAKLPTTIRAADHDEVSKFLLLSNSHDGCGAVQVKFTPIRVVCQNTLSLALSTGRTFSARHDRDLAGGLRDVRAALGFIESRFASIEETIRRMVAVPLTRERREAFFARVFPNPRDFDDERGKERVDACRFWAAHFAEHGQGNTEKAVHGTLWAAYNGVTEMLDHAGGVMLGPRAATRRKAVTLPVRPTPDSPPDPPGPAVMMRQLESSWFGAGARAKIRAWDVAVEMSK